jgi:hypothetical protein
MVNFERKARAIESLMSMNLTLGVGKANHDSKNWELKYDYGNYYLWSTSSLLNSSHNCNNLSIKEIIENSIRA